jgi:hypothetical protein
MATTTAIGDEVPVVAEYLSDEILAHPDVVETEASIAGLLERVRDKDLAAALDNAIHIDHYCATIRATLTAALARETTAGLVGEATTALA